MARRGVLMTRKRSRKRLWVIKENATDTGTLEYSGCVDDAKEVGCHAYTETLDFNLFALL